MKFLGFYLGRHDSNVTLVDNGQVRYFKAERMFGIKHEFRPYHWVKEVCGDFRPDAVAYSDGDRNGLGQCDKYQMWKPMKKLFRVPTYCLDHYYAHVLSAWPVINIEKVDIGIGLDGKGDHSYSRRVIRNPGNIQRVTSYGALNGKAVGRFFAKVGHYMGLRVGKLSTGLELTIDYAGKVMGAHAYGENKGKIGISPKQAFNDPYKMLKSLPKNVRFGNQKFLNWLAEAHDLIGQGLLEYFGKHCKKADCIAYAGGVAQNTVYNNMLFSAYPGLHIPPHCYDGGMSLGCVEFLRLRYEQPKFNTSGFPYWQRDIEHETPTVETIKRVAELLAQGKIVGWFQGQGEVGPRALGHRSILMSPDGSKDRLNKAVKHREPWRPFAPSILEEYADDWFYTDRKQPYMLRTVKVKSDRIPAVTHVDGTSRIQTVDSNQIYYWGLLREFYEKTGIPMLLNTSFNGGGEPIYSSRDQCLKLFKNSDMDAVCMGCTLHEK